jgi:hypothetical protein
MVCAVAALAVLNLANPRAIIARYNLAHQDRREADVEHLARLGADATPILVAHLHQIPADRRCWLTEKLVNRHGTQRGDWRGWNLARSRAQNAVRALPPDC